MLPACSQDVLSGMLPDRLAAQWAAQHAPGRNGGGFFGADGTDGAAGMAEACRGCLAPGLPAEVPTGRKAPVRRAYAYASRLKISGRTKFGSV